MGASADTRAWTLPATLLLLAAGVGAIAGINPGLGVAAAMGLAFVTIVMADLAIGLCLYALLAFLNIVPDVGSSFLSFDKVAGALLALSWIATVANRRRARRAFVSAHPQFFAVLVFFLVWTSLSLIWAEHPGHGLESAVRYVLNAFLFLIVFSAVRTRKHVIWLLSAFVVASALSAAYGLITPPIPGDEGRLSGTIGEPNQLAAVLVAGLVLSAALAIVSKGKPLTRVAMCVAALLCLICTYLTLSRAGLIALAVAMVALVAFAGRWRIIAAVMATLAVVSLVGFFAFLATPQQTGRVTEVGGGSGRSDIWTIGTRMVQANPVKGVGVGQFQSSAVHYLIAPGAIERSDLIITAPKVAHNIYLQVLSEMGVIGLIPFVTILGFSLRCALRAAHLFERRRDVTMEILSRAVLVGLIGILTADFFASEQFSKQLWLLLGLGPALLAMAQRGADEEERTEPDAPPAGPLAPDRLEPAPALPVRTVPA